MPELEELLEEELGIKLGHSTDHEVFGYCPGHMENLGRKDRSPRTWSVSRYTGAHYCFACTYGGSMIELIQYLRPEVGLWQALKLMREYGLEPADPNELPESYHSRKPRRNEESIKFMSEQELEQFEPVPREVAAKRGLRTDSLDYYGVLWDADIKAWITPIRLGPGGRLMGWQAKNKRLFDNYPAEVPKSLTLFGIDKLVPHSTAILVESPLDVVKLHSEGFDNGVSSFGVAVSEDQMRLLLSMTQDVVLALDNDDNGERWTRRLITGDRGAKKPRGVAWATKFNMTVFNYKRTDAKDPGEMTGDEIEWALAHAIHSTEY